MACFAGSPRSIRGCSLVRWANELTPRGHLRPLGGRENPRRARPESRSPRRCVHAWWRCLLFAGRPEGINQGTHDRHARANPRPQLHMRKGVNRNPSRRPGLAVSDSNLHAVKTGHSELAAFPGFASKSIGGRWWAGRGNASTTGWPALASHCWAGRIRPVPGVKQSLNRPPRDMAARPRGYSLSPNRLSPSAKQEAITHLDVRPCTSSREAFSPRPRRLSDERD